MAQVKVVACTCGDCIHWEIIKVDASDAILKCMTCGHEFHANVVIAHHEKLKTIEAER